MPPAALAPGELTYLEELRSQAAEQRIELDLELGDTGDLVAELRALIAEHPLRERFWALLMRALRRAGRSAEALAAFHEADRLLGAELGAEPGQELRGLHAKLLAGTRAPEPGTNLARLRELLAEALQVVTAFSR